MWYTNYGNNIHLHGLKKTNLHFRSVRKVLVTAGRPDIQDMWVQQGCKMFQLHFLLRFLRQEMIRVRGLVHGAFSVSDLITERREQG
jgi:hypothetical protein